MSRPTGNDYGEKIINLRIHSLIEVTFIIHAAIMLGQFDAEDYCRDEEKQAVANGEPEAIL